MPIKWPNRWISRSLLGIQSYRILIIRISWWPEMAAQLVRAAVESTHKMFHTQTLRCRAVKLSYKAPDSDRQHHPSAHRLCFHLTKVNWINKVTPLTSRLQRLKTVDFKEGIRWQRYGGREKRSVEKESQTCVTHWFLSWVCPGTTNCRLADSSGVKWTSLWKGGLMRSWPNDQIWIVLQSFRLLFTY